MHKFTNKITTYYLISIFYLFILIFAAFCIIPYVDSYYYWLWSQHLQTSYFDGPPMIAYVIRLFTIIFGNSVLAINLVGLAIALISTYIVIQIANLLSSSTRDNFIVGLLWLSNYAITSHRIITFVTYDGLVNLFELAMVLFTLKYIYLRKNYYIYLIGACAGFALLSKYSGIILIIIILLCFTANKELRAVFKQPHVYLSMILCIAIFSPVLIWNYQHGGESFAYQLTFHSYAQKITLASISKHVFYYINTTVLQPALPLLIVLLFTLYINRKNSAITIQNTFNNQYAIKFVLLVMLGVFIFWLCMSTFSDIPDRYMLLLQSLLTVIAGSIFLKLKYYRLLFAFIVLSIFYSTLNIISHCIQTKNPYCYSVYIKSGLLKFDSPLAKYIRPHPKASNFCYTEIRTKW